MLRKNMLLHFKTIQTKQALQARKENTQITVAGRDLKAQCSGSREYYNQL